ncbi:MAG: hypothetical protein JNM36_09840 [Chitinophagales bacterium]|nr:hypothetical protein [Chitinophagales bacterium]
MNTLSFDILPINEYHDYEVRILIDNSDILGNDYLGIDPPEFFEQHNLLTAGRILIGRCSCGVVGCDDYPVYVNVFNDKVIWTNDDGLNLAFDKSAYEKTILHAKIDHTWESKERRIERLTSDVLKNTKTIDDYKFDWTSARIKENIIMVSYSKDGQQKLFEFNWDGQTEQSALKEANHFLTQRPIQNIL